MTTASEALKKLQTGEKVDGHWEVIKLIGEGGFDAQAPIRERVLRMEVVILRRMRMKRATDGFGSSGKRHFCQLEAVGQTCMYRYIVMTLVGKSVSLLRRRCGGKFNGRSVAHVAIESLMAIKELHEIGYIHRDIKPSNLAIGVPPCFDSVYLIDFGLCGAYRHEDGRLRRPRDVDINPVFNDLRRTRRGFLLQFAGPDYRKPILQYVRAWILVRKLNEQTPAGSPKVIKNRVYAPMACHKNEDMCRRDDLWSWLYMLIELSQGKLAWHALMKEVQKMPFKHQMERVGAMKNHLNQNPVELLTGCAVEFLELHSLISTLAFYDTPNYSAMLDALKKIEERRRRPDKDDSKLDWEPGGKWYEKVKFGDN